MSINAALNTKVAATGAITSVIDSPPKFYPMAAPTSAALPYVIYTIIDNPHLEHQRGIAGLCYANIQLDFYGASSVSASAVHEVFRGVFQGHLLGTWGSVAIKRVFWHGHRELYEPSQNGAQLGEGGKYRIFQEMDVWYAES